MEGEPILERIAGLFLDKESKVRAAQAAVLRLEDDLSSAIVGGAVEMRLFEVDELDFPLVDDASGKHYPLSPFREYLACSERPHYVF